MAKKAQEQETQQQAQVENTQEQEMTFVVDELDEIKSWASQNARGYSIYFTYDELDGFPAIRKSIRAIEKCLGIPKRSAEEDLFIKLNINKEGFQGFKYPDIGLVNIEGKETVAAIWHNVIVPIEETLQNAKNAIKFRREKEGTSAQYFLIVSPPDDEQAEAFSFRISTKISDETHNEFKLRNLSYLKGMMSLYTFPRTWLKDGIYDIQRYACIDNKFFIATINGNQYYLSETQYEALKSNEAEKRPLRLIIDGSRSYVKNGELRTVRNEYIEGHAPAVYFTECMEQLFRNAIQNGHFGELSPQNDHAFVKRYLVEIEKGNQTPNVVSLIVEDLLNTAKSNKADTKKRNSLVVEPELKIQLSGIQSCKVSKANRFGFQLQLRMNDTKCTAIPNTAIKDAKQNGMFSNVVFDESNPIYLVINEIEYWETTENNELKINKKFCILWEVPREAQNFSSKFQKLAAKFAK